MRLVIGPATSPEYKSVAKRFLSDYVISLIGEVDGYLADPGCLKSFHLWVQILCPDEVVIARSSCDVSSPLYLQKSKRSREELELAGIPVSETFYSSSKNFARPAPAIASIDCVDSRLNEMVLNGAGGDIISRLPGGLAPFLQGDPVAQNELDLLRTLCLNEVRGCNHQDCKAYAYAGHRPLSFEEDLAFHQEREIPSATQLFQKRGISFIGNFHRF
ncbi:MAG: hypothetical protein Q8P70_01275 [bacterium]|nr:hypothetical protein [bacterium]